MADPWPRLANSGLPFENRSPIEAMIAGGIPLMLEADAGCNANCATMQSPA
jgi:hypothetical protein